jgi:EH_Signature domain
LNSANSEPSLGCDMADARSCFEILAELERLSSGLHQDAPPSIPSDRAIGRLRATVARLSQPKKARAVRCPPNYIELWNTIGAFRSAELSSRAIRYLSWETDIAIRPVFQSVALTPERISARSLQGLVRSMHRRWDSTVNTPSVENLRVALTTYVKKNALIDKWKQNLVYVLNAEGPTRFATDVLARGTTWDKVAEEWGLEPDTEFGNAVLTRCGPLSLASRRGEDFQNAIRFVLPSNHWRPDSFKSCVQQLILASSRLSPQQSDTLRDFILNDRRLLDPRLPANGLNWTGISDAARDTVIQWLSAEDIQLFFDHVLTTRNDPHGRKPFWLRYKGKVKRSRPLLSALDESRWLANTATREKRNFGRMEYLCSTSAFLLDFGRVMVVEFSQVNNAVYVYEHREIPDLNDAFWSQARFSLSTLKQKDRCIERMTHTPHWQSKMRTLLAQFGIHPGA